ncbi:MAG: polymerase, sigma subunit, family [Pseudonocardiales bacterium]|nr:polymerase, sigma subunit, family [Pseudonocardiales bacterium]
MSADDDFARLADPFRRELLAHCYRMLGSIHDAEDLVQETYLRAWRAYSDFEARSSMRTWLYRIATNACLNALDKNERRVLPSGLGAASDDPDAPPANRLDTIAWLQPIPDMALSSHPADPATIVQTRESTRLAFIAALQHLPPRQRAVLVLRDVLGWHADEVAALLDSTSASVNSALQRARAQIDRAAPREDTISVDAQTEAEVVDRFVTAFESADLDALAELLRKDVQLEMPPIPTWFAGRENVLGFLGRRVLPSGPWRLVTTRANGYPATATYRLEPDGTFGAHSVQILEIVDGAIVHLRAFRDLSLFTTFGLPMTLDATAR